MRILISNDDGVGCAGTRLLAEAVASWGEVTVVVPHRERSTAGHAMTLHKPLRIHSLGGGWYTTTGTPADCVYLGIREILRQRPDLVLAGINTGANLGTDIYYSGTVAAARESALLGIPSYALSLVNLTWTKSDTSEEPFRFDVAAKVATRVVEMTRDIEFPERALLNVNIPNLEFEKLKGVAVARQGVRHYSSEVIRRTDPRGKPYYWIGGVYQGYEGDEESDCELANRGYVTVVPVSIDNTHAQFYQTLKGVLATSLE